MLAMPGERIGRGRSETRHRRAQVGALQVIIVAPVIEVGLEPMADLEATILRDCNIAKVEEAVDVGAKQQAVGRIVLAAFAIGLDVGRIEDRQSPFPRNGAAAVIGIGNRQPESALAEPRPDGTLKPS